MLKTLRAKLLAFFFLVTIIPLLFVGYIFYNSQKEELTKQIEDSLVLHSNHLADETESMLIERVHNLMMLSENPVLKNENSTEEQINEQLQSFLDVYKIYSDVIMVDTEGTVYTSMIDGVVGNDFSERIWFQSSIRGNVYISDIYFSPIINQPILVMSAPIINDRGEVIAVISPSFDLQYLWQTYDQFTEDQQELGNDGYAFLMNKKGEVIAHPDHEKILLKNYLAKNDLTTVDLIRLSNEKAIHYNDHEGTVLSFAHIDGMGRFEIDWFVGISVSQDLLFSPLKQLLTKFLFVMGFVLLITSLAVKKLSNYLVAPVEKLVEASSDFAIGKKVPPLLDAPYEEIERLNNTFIHMTKILEERDRSHKKSTLILENTNYGVIAINRDKWMITSFNRQCEQFFQISRNEVINGDINNVVNASASFNEFFIAIQNEIDLNTVNREMKKFEMECAINGKVYEFFVNISLLPSIKNGSNNNEVLIMFNDLTEKKQMEKELFRSEKLKLVGEMSAGLAHEIRNPLAIIRGFIQLFSEEEKGSKLKYYDIIIKEIDRVNHFISDLLNIANPKTNNDMKETNIVYLMEDLLTLQKAQLINKNIIVDKKYVELPLVKIEQNKFQQVCINIVQNAIEAMDKGGILTVGTQFIRDENKVLLFIGDNGIGMCPESLEKLGTPFHTTKESGTGLGLATSFKIIEEMNGSISAESEIGKGTTFTITLPVNV